MMYSGDEDYGDDITSGPIHLDLAPDVQIEFGVCPETEWRNATETQAEWEARILDQRRRPFLVTVRGADGLIRAEWTRYAVDLEQAREEVLAAACREYGDGATVTARSQTREEGIV
jgi:hypothetical protein